MENKNKMNELKVQKETKEESCDDEKSLNINILNQIKSFGTIISADSADLKELRKYCINDATTNPTLILQVINEPKYKNLIEDAINYSLNYSESQRHEVAIDKLMVNFGSEIVKIVPGYVSTEVDARLSFDTQRTIDRARKIIEMYKEMNVDKSRILIKIASTYEGIQAAKLLEKEGIKCNLTLCFSLIQAACAADAGVYLVSPFVGRILDWYIAKYKDDTKFEGTNDPGVLLVQNIYYYLKKFNYNTIVMGASIRNINEAISLSGCDRLTIPLKVMKELSENYTIIEKKLDSKLSSAIYTGNKLLIDKKSFQDTLNNDEMANEKLLQGINSFSDDTIKIENLLLEGLMSQMEFKELSKL